MEPDYSYEHPEEEDEVPPESIESLQVRVFGLTDSLKDNLKKLKSDAHAQADQLAELEHLLAETTYFLEKAEKRYLELQKEEDVLIAQMNPNWPEVKKLGLELSRMIQAQQARLAALRLKEDATKRRFDSLVEELNDRIDALSRSHQKILADRARIDVTAWPSFQIFSAMLIPASVFLAIVAYRKRIG